MDAVHKGSERDSLNIIIEQSNCKTKQLIIIIKIITKS
jgi:hypothetical protein